MRKIFMYSILVLSLCSCAQKSRVDILLDKMTLDEKIGQLNQLTGNQLTGTDSNSNQEQKIRDGKVGSILNVKGAAACRHLQEIAVNETRLGIPIVTGLDVIHGYRTTFPIPLAMSCSWDTVAIRNACRTAAIEASSCGTAWTFTPMCDIARDPRWGRIAEGAGEDPFLGSAIAAAQVKGFQGNFEDNTCIAACVKHFALYGAPQAGKDYASVDMSRQKMFNDYLPPYQAAVDAGALTVMSSFNDFEEIPLSLNRYMLTDLLRGTMGFKGMLVTDYAAIKECIAHGAAADLEEGAAKALDAGVDMDMVDEAFITHLADAVRKGMVSEKQIDAACRRVLEFKERLGLFDDPYKYCRENEEKLIFEREENMPQARDIAAECIVLLKNDGKALPLKGTPKIAVIGPLGNSSEEMLGSWCVRSSKTGHQIEPPVSLYKGMCNRFGRANVSFAPGCHVVENMEVAKKLALDKNALCLERSDADLLAEAMRTAAKADVIVAAMGELAWMAGEGASRADISLPRPQRELLKKLVATGKKVILVTMAGRPLLLDWESENVPAILNAWQLGSQAGNAIADVISGDVNPSGHLTTTFPRSLGQIPICYNHKSSGRPRGDFKTYKRFKSCYQDVVNAPLYYFGHGLSYSNVEYRNLQLSADSLDRASLPLKVTVDLYNSSDIDGVEVVQLYIHDVAASSTRPVKELKGFQRVVAQSDRIIRVEFTIGEKELGFYNHDLRFVTEPGKFEIFVGPSADWRCLQRAEFTLL